MKRFAPISESLLQIMPMLTTLLLAILLIDVTFTTFGSNNNIQTSNVMASPLIETTVYRGIMYDRRIGSAEVLQHGSRSVLLRGYVALYNATSLPTSSTSSSDVLNDSNVEENKEPVEAVGKFEEYIPYSMYVKQTVYIPCTSHLSKSLMDSFVRISIRGLLLPLCTEDTFNEEFLAPYIVNNAALKFPVYFIEGNDDIKHLENALNSQTHSSQRVVISVAASEKVSKTYENNTIEGLLIYNQIQYKPDEIRQAMISKQTRTLTKNTKEVSKNQEYKKQGQQEQQQDGEIQTILAKDIPRVLISASFDTLGVAPAARTNASASALVGAMELWRRMTTLLASEPFVSLSSPHTENTSKNNNSANDKASSNFEHTTGSVQSNASNNIHPFVLTMLLSNSARFNYINTAEWLSSQREVDLNRLKIAITLDELTSMELDGNINVLQPNDPISVELYMHIQDSLVKRADGQALQSLALRTAARYNVNLYIVPTKPNYRHYDIRFEHEVFAHRQIPAATFSAFKSAHVDQLFRDRQLPEMTDAVLYKLRRRVDFIEGFVRELINISTETIAQVAAEESSAANIVHGIQNRDWKPSVLRPERWAGSMSYLQGMSHFIRHAVRSPVAQSFSDHDDAKNANSKGKTLHTWKDRRTGNQAYLNRGSSSKSDAKLSITPQHQFAQQIEQHLKSLNARLTNVPVFATSTLQSSTMKLGSITLYGPYEEKIKIFIALQTRYELLTTCLIVSLLFCFAVYQYSFAGLQYMILGDKTWHDVMQLLKKQAKKEHAPHQNSNTELCLSEE